MTRLIPALILALLAWAPPPAAASDPPIDVAALQQQIARLRAELDAATTTRPAAVSIAASVDVEAALAAIEARNGPAAAAAIAADIDDAAQFILSRGGLRDEPS